MAFDSNQAWKDASSSVAANRDVLVALGGVFFALPAFALALFIPPPAAPEGADGKAAMALLGEYYSHAWPALLAVALISLLGSLSVMTLFTDRSRPTVGEAIRNGARATGPVLVAQLLIGLVAATAMTLVLLLGSLSGNPAIAALLTVLVGLGMAYLFIRFAMVSPAVVVEGLRNPVQALRRSWELTRGNVLHLLAFFVLLLVAFGIVYLLIAKGIGLIAALVTSGAVTVTINDLVASCLQAVMSIYSVAVIAATHRQLAGPSANRLAPDSE